MFRLMSARLCGATLLTAMVLVGTDLHAQSQDGMSAEMAEVKAAVAENRLQTTRALGGTLGHNPFHETAGRPGLLVGMDLSLGKSGRIEVIYAVRAVYETTTGTRLGADHGLFAFHTSKGKKSKASRVVQVRAKPGYAVSGLAGRAGLSLNGLALTFQRVKDGKLDPQDSYQSAWIGDRSGGGEFTCDCKGMLVVGIHGKEGDVECRSLGLVHVAVPKKAPTPPATKRPAPRPAEPVTPKPAPPVVARPEVKPAPALPIPELPVVPLLPEVKVPFPEPPPAPAIVQTPPAVTSPPPTESALAGWMIPVGVGLVVTVLGVGGVLLVNQPREQAAEDVPPRQPRRGPPPLPPGRGGPLEVLPEQTEEITEPDGRITASSPTPTDRPAERQVDGLGNLEL